jgi:hypothetical protein
VRNWGGSPDNQNLDFARTRRPIARRDKVRNGANARLLLSNDGLEREFNFFNVLEGGMCTMCAPGDQRKFSNNQRDQRCTDGTLSQ